MSYNGLVSNTDGHSIPTAKFIGDVESFVGDHDPIVVTNVAKELLAKYRFMEKSMISKLSALTEKLPELNDSIKTLECIKKKHETGDDSDLQTFFKISDTLYAEANIPLTKQVYLWLGANTMVEYPVDDAIVLLNEQLNNARGNVDNVNKELEWLRKQITSTEITVARLHNFCVTKKNSLIKETSA